MKGEIFYFMIQNFSLIKTFCDEENIAFHNCDLCLYDSQWPPDTF